MPRYEVRALQQQLKVYADGRYVAAVQQGRFRPYVYPVFTPAGHLVTQIAPADHLHHLSIWAAHEDVNGVDFWAPETRETFPLPKILVRETETLVDAHGVTFRQRIEWVNGEQGVELRETRTTTVTAHEDGNAIDLVCQLQAPGHEVVLGQTKEAGLAVRVADQIDVLDGGRIVNAAGEENEAHTFDRVSAWVDYAGPVTRGALAGVALFPYPEAADTPWFTRDYGPVFLNPWRHRPLSLAPGKSCALGVRVVAHDGSCEQAGVAALYERFRAELGR